ncbi:protein NUCLEAR FUSION DEFECTIVE 4 [Physcomitrium patens]|uniref:Uncharacterized protein n=1 Tax=Physcomitrium patens TaxID=3218 RepID=A0A2K1IUX1_PHYPA|nr:protein NUCLEAR FUSION DEFECTIVE 4-like [Physcomitrium patens]PNR33072.1 hypothetical protein PHYPA_025015 [Physcomitrium patens]|eukprot:XP_024358278.1 protein NUCLEAR FUSION DEFECTIVE 4-like [Physcomitrella patens]
MNTRDFTWRVLKSKWFILAAGLWIESIAGAAYSFGVYSQSLKVALGYDQQWLDTLAFFKSIGGNFGVLSGLLYDVAPPWLVVLAGAAECSFGYSMLWLSVTKRIRPAFWQMCIFIGMASNCNTLFSTACVVTNVKNFPNKRGLVIGLLKGFLGLSGAILTQVFFVMYPNDPSSFLLLISWLPAVVSIILAPVIRVVPASDGDNATFRDFSTISTCLAACLTLVIILENVLKNDTWPVWIACLSLLGFFLSLCVVIIKAEAKDYKADLIKGRVRGQGSISEPLLRNDDGRHPYSRCSENQSSSVHAKLDWSASSDPEIPESPNEGDNPLSEQIEEVAKPSDGTSAGLDQSVGVPRRGEEHTLSQAISSLDFWLLVVAMFCSMGSGTTAIDNMGQIGLSLGYEQVEINTFISLISIWNFLGRFGAGLISELLLHMRGYGRPFCLAFSLGLMCIGHLVMATAVTGSLYVGSIIVGVCYGAQWSLMPAVTSDIFGLQHFGTLYNTIAIASPVAAYVLSVQVAGYFYDKEAHEQHKPATLIGRIPSLISSGSDNPLLCHGPSCFRTTFIILALVCAFGCTVCLWLFARTKRFYVQVHENLHKVELR